MNMFSLRTLVDDILLIVRNNNISESEDFSRALIAAWVLHYKALLTKEDKDKKEAEDGTETYFDESLCKTIGPLDLEKIGSLDKYPLFLRRTVDKIDDLYESDPNNIIAVFDQLGHPIQRMHRLRRHYLWSRKYTSGDLTYFYEGGKINIQGNADCCILDNIWVKYIADESDDEIEDEDAVTIPGWMVPTIKDRIFKNELSFMIKMPSDDDNNSTLDGIKPHGPQDLEK